LKSRVVGLTGGIGSGKSTVGRMLESLGAHVIDADRIAHNLYDSDPDLTDELQGLFGKDIVDPESGKIDRKALGSLVFADPEKRERLESYLHPKIRERIQREIDSAKSKSPLPLIVVEAALMVETGYYKNFDGLIVVKAEPHDQKARISKRDGATEDEVSRRMATQASLSEKLKEATWVIDNSGTLEETRKQVERLYETLKVSFVPSAPKAR